MNEIPIYDLRVPPPLFVVILRGLPLLFFKLWIVLLLLVTLLSVAQVAIERLLIFLGGGVAGLDMEWILPAHHSLLQNIPRENHAFNQ